MLHERDMTAVVHERRSRILAVSAPAGGVEALRKLVAELPGDFPGSVFVVLHTAPNSPGREPPPES